MIKVQIELPEAILVRTVDGKPVRLDVKKLAEFPAVIAGIFEGGAKTVLTNTWNSGGKERTDVERMAQLEKRMASWYKGEYVMAERGESAYTGMWQAYVDDIRAKAECTVKDVEDQRRATIAAVFGENEKVSTATFFKALATLIAKENGTEVQAELEAVEGFYAGLAAEAEQRRAQAKAKLDVSGLALAGFLKPKAA